MIGINLTVAVGLIRFHLSGYQGYPKTEAGENVFGRCLCDCTVGVAHAEAVLKHFKEGFPNCQQIIDTATNLRDRFEPPADERAEWERLYGKPEKIKFDTAAVGGGQEYRAMWAKLREHFTRTHGGSFPGWKDIPWSAIHAAQKELGYSLTAEQERMAS